MKTQIIAVCAVTVVSTACGGSGAAGCKGPVAMKACVTKTAITNPGSKAWPDPRNAMSVEIYIDRSGSMRGFLDQEFSTGKTYRLVLDRLVVAVAPRAVFGYGSSLTTASASLGVLGNKAFYQDNSTRMEQALERVRADSALSTTYIIVGDGRRGSPNDAYEQFSQMRAIAASWIRAGGHFIVGASLAPFAPVAGDPAGCSSADGTCPLYAFAFVAPDQESSIYDRIFQVFDETFIWPVPAAAPNAIRLVPDQRRPEFVFVQDFAKASDGSPVALVDGQTATTNPINLAVQISEDRAEGALTSQRLRLELYSTPLSASAPSWTKVQGSGSLVRVDSAAPLVYRVVSYGAKTPPVLYRIDLRPMGLPDWIAKYSATSAKDAVRTFGLDRLFEPFAQAAISAPQQPAARVYILTN